MSIDRLVESTEHLISSIKKDYQTWDTYAYPWFRGEPNKPKTALKPKLYREKHNENRLLQQFRMKAPALGIENIPPRGHIDQWLFLAQHVGLPTRLLDWTEGLFIALHFALEEKEPIIWMLNPNELNKKTIPNNKENVYPLTWLNKSDIPATSLELHDIAVSFIKGEQLEALDRFEKERLRKLVPNVGNYNILAAWNNGREQKWGTDFPIAILPTNIHPRMSNQKSCFTIQGIDESSLVKLVDEKILLKYVIVPAKIKEFKKDLRMMGITHTSIFPDLDRLAKELGELF